MNLIGGIRIFLYISFLVSPLRDGIQIFQRCRVFRCRQSLALNANGYQRISYRCASESSSLFWHLWVLMSSRKQPHSIYTVVDTERNVLICHSLAFSERTCTWKSRLRAASCGCELTTRISCEVQVPWRSIADMIFCVHAFKVSVQSERICMGESAASQLTCP